MSTLFDLYTKELDRNNGPMQIRHGTRIAQLGRLIDGHRLIGCDDLAFMIEPGKPKRWQTDDGRTWLVTKAKTVLPDVGTELWLACVMSNVRAIPAKIELLELTKMNDNQFVNAQVKP